MIGHSLLFQLLKWIKFLISEKAPFCFNKKHLEIRKGDSVIFSWKTPSTSASTAFNMFETDSLESKLPKEGGFTTGSVQTKEGNSSTDARI
jgi:hypothetical protein